MRRERAATSPSRSSEAASPVSLRARCSRRLSRRRADRRRRGCRGTGRSADTAGTRRRRRSSPSACRARRRREGRRPSSVRPLDHERPERCAVGAQPHIGHELLDVVFRRRDEGLDDGVHGRRGQALAGQQHADRAALPRVQARLHDEAEPFAPCQIRRAYGMQRVLADRERLRVAATCRRGRRASDRPR